MTIVLDTNSRNNDNMSVHNDDNTQNAIIVRQNTTDGEMEFDEENEENSQQQSSTQDNGEESFDLE